MRVCLSCHTFYRDQTRVCQHCDKRLLEISLTDAMEFSSRQSFEERIGGAEDHKLPDAYKQYHVRSYLQNRSLFLDFDLHKNRLKKSRRLKSFFITPLGLGSLFNLPWLLFNILSTNIFHLTYTEYCPRCDCKFVKGQHSQNDCDYNIQYFRILNDILSGRITTTKIIYEQYALENDKTHLKSAYHDLFDRKIRTETFWDFISIWLTVLFWVYIIVHISYPLAMTGLQKIQQYEMVEIVTTE